MTAAKKAAAKKPSAPEVEERDSTHVATTVKVIGAPESDYAPEDS